MHSSQLTAARVAGALLAGLSLVTAARWVLPWEAVAALVPGSRNVGFANPLLFGMASIGIFAAEAAIVQAPRHRWLAQLNKLAIALLLVLPLLQLFQTLSGLNFGLDLPSPGSGPTTSVPGRLSPNACIAFTCIGLALWLLPRPRSRGWERAYLASTLVVAFIGLAALAGYFLRLETLYQVANHNRLLPVTALGFVVASAALWALHVRTQAFDLRDAAKRIQRRSLAVVTLLTLSAGVAGFASMRDTFEESAANTMLQSTVNNATSLAYSLDTALWYPKTLATRPTVLQGLERLSRDPADAQARAALQNIATSFLKAELSQAEFYNAQGEMVAGVGVSVGKETKVRHPLLNTGQDAVLAWGADGYYLLTDNPVQLDGRPVGRLKTEQPLRLVNQLLEQMRLADATSDAALCGRSGDKALCAATRFRQPAFELPLHGMEGQAASAIANALEGRTGMLFARDPRNKEVLTAYAPLKQYGLALGFKTDLDTLYAPLRSRLLLLVAAMALLIALAIYALRSQVQPVLMRLVESERKMKAILDEQSELVSLAAPDGTITYVNPSYARHFGLTESQLIGTNLFDHVLPADRQEVRDKIARVMGTGVPVVNENRMLVPQGTECWVAWTNRLQRGPHGEPLLHSVGRDVTERKQLEDALRELTTIFDNTTDYVIQTGLRGNITYLNPAARAVLGIAPDAPVTSMRFSDFNTPETNERLAKVIIPAVNEKGIWLGETVFHAGDGRPLPVSHMVIGHRDKQGRVTRYSGIMRDITQELASKREQQRQAATLRAITEAIPGFVAVIDTDRRYRFVNSGFERWVGQPRGQIIGKTVAEVLGPVNYAASLPWMERALAGESVSFERVHEGHAVTRHLAMSYIPMFGEDGRVEGFIGVGQDITEHRQEEGRLLELSQRDPLTGLLNRSGFEQFLERLAHDPLAHQGVALLYLDLDHFKPVNDTHGHRVGDQLLQQFAERLQGTVRPSDAVARLGGDEFAIVLVGMRDPAHADAVADKVVSAARAPFTVGELTLHIGASVGVAFGDVGPAGWRELLERADTRLYQAKAEGRGRYAV